MSAPTADPAAGDLRAALSDPALHPGRPPRVTVRETHISWVFLAGERAYKLKKPVVLPFVDYGTPRRRRRLCREEVRLNRRLAPDVYLGVRALVPTPEGPRLADEDDPRAVDYVVEMRRYDERATLAATLARGELTLEQAAQTGRVLARFHAGARRVATGGAQAPLVERRIAANFQELLALVEQRAETERVLALERFVHAFAIAHATLLQRRAAEGWVREVHGDLRAEHVLLGERLEVVDCVEFDRGLREIDVADDLAFLVMDLTALGGERFARALVEAYRAAGGDPGEERLISFYALHRALVRAKVELVRAGQSRATSAAHGRHGAAARALVELAERFAWRARLPLAIVVCGVPAAGKSSVAQALAAASGLPHLSSDVTRKQLAGLTPTRRAPGELYAEDWSRLTYAELGRRAAREIAAHGGAILDASFRRRRDRDAFAEAFAGAAPLLFLECRAPAQELARRAARRERDPERVSDASLEVVLRERSAWEPLEEVAPQAHVALRSDRPVEDVLADVTALLDRRIDLAVARRAAR